MIDEKYKAELRVLSGLNSEESDCNSWYDIILQVASLLKAKITPLEIIEKRKYEAEGRYPVDYFIGQCKIQLQAVNPNKLHYKIGVISNYCSVVGSFCTVTYTGEN